MQIAQQTSEQNSDLLTKAIKHIRILDHSKGVAGSATRFIPFHIYSAHSADLNASKSVLVVDPSPNALLT